MSKEHRQLAATVKCINSFCGIRHTTFIMINAANHKKIVCPGCGYRTYQKDLEIIEIHPTVPIP